MLTQAASGIDLFLPETYDIVWSLVILAILIFFFAKFFMPKMNKVLDERAQRIQGRMDQAEQVQKEAEELKSEYEQRLANAKSEASHIREDARAEASHIREDARSKADSVAKQITANAQKAVEAQKLQAMNALRDELGQMATELASKIVAQHLENDQAQSDMIDSLLDSMEKDQDSAQTSTNSTNNQ